MLFLVTAVSAIVPSLLLIWYFYARDVHREPARVLWATFGLGVLSIIPTLVFALPVAALLKPVRDPYALGVLEAFLTAAVPEELFKGSVLLLYCWNHDEFDEPMDGIVYGAIASLGFATFENILYVAKGGLGLAILRAVTAVPGHAFLGAVLGYHVGRAKFHPAKRVQLVVTGYLLAVLLHGLYDFPILIHKNFDDLKLGKPPGGAAWLFLITLAAIVFEAVWTVRKVRGLRADQQHVVAVRAAWAGVAPPGSARLLGAPAPAPPRSPGVCWLMLLGGGLLASAGGLVVLAVILAVLFAPPSESGSGGALAGGAILGLPPLVLGLFLFTGGLRRLGAPRAPAPLLRRAA